MRTCAILFFVLSVYGILVALINVTAGTPDAIGNPLAYAVGSFFVPLALLIIGLNLMG